MQFPLIMEFAYLRLEAVIFCAKCKSFIIPMYWPVTYKSVVQAATSVKPVALYCDLWLAAI